MKFEISSRFVDMISNAISDRWIGVKVDLSEDDLMRMLEAIKDEERKECFVK